jgi:outer membrane protein assembly factor BamB
MASTFLSRRNILPPAILLLLTTIATATAHQLADGRTDQIIRVYYGAGFLILSLSVWWLGFSSLQKSKRVSIWFATVFTCTLLAFACIRSVWFDGDMRPRLVFRWSPPSASERAREWLKANAPTTTAAPAPASASTPATLEITPLDWPRYCGHNGDRSIPSPLPATNWNTTPPTELWRRPVGDAWSSMAIVGNRLWTQEQRGELECTVCYDSQTGTELWRREDKARYETAQGAIGPRATPTVSPHAVFSLGATGLLNALEPSTGKLLWQRQICDDAGSTMVEWGMSGSPLLYKQLVIVDAGGNSGRALAAYDQATGTPVWSVGSHKAGYTAPRLEVINGQTQLLVFHGDGLEAHDPDTGTSLWFYPWTNQYKINVAQPIRFDNTLFLSSGYDSGCVLLDPIRLNNQRPAEVWPPTRSLKLKFNEAVALGSHVYGLDDGILACVNATTGERLWKGGRYRYGHVLLWQNTLLVQAEDGAVALVAASPAAFKEITRFQPLNDRTWNVPAVAHGKLFVRNAAEMACFSLPPAATASPSPSGDGSTASIHSPPSAASSDAPAASSDNSSSQAPRTDDASPAPAEQP